MHLVEHVHELHRLGLHLTTDLVKLCDEVVVSKERHDTVTRKKISRRKMTSVIEAMLKVSATLVLRLSAMRSWVR